MSRLILILVAALACALGSHAQASGSTACAGYDGSPRKLPYQVDKRQWAALSTTISFELNGAICGDATEISTSGQTMTVRAPYDGPPEFMFVRISPATVLLLSNDTSVPRTVLKSPFEVVGQRLELGNRRVDDMTIERSYRLDITIFDIPFEVYLTILQRTDKHVMIREASYSRLRASVGQAPFTLTSTELTNGYVGSETLRFPPPKSTADLHAAYRALAAIREPLRRATYAPKANAWVGLCHPEHPLYGLACPQAVCSSRQSYIRSKCDLATRAVADSQPSSSSLVPKLLNQVLSGNPNYDARSGRWMDACHPDNAKYFQNCSYVRLVMASRLGYECMEKLKTQKPPEWEPLTPGDLGAVIFVALMSQRFPMLSPPKSESRCNEVFTLFDNGGNTTK